MDSDHTRSPERGTTESGSGEGPLGIFERQTRIGAASGGGASRYDRERQEYVIGNPVTQGSKEADALQFLWRRLGGDFILTARVQFPHGEQGPAGDVGWMVRAGMEPDSAYAGASIGAGGTAVLTIRRTPGAAIEEMPLVVSRPDVIQLERAGDALILSAAHFGEPFVTRRVARVRLGDEVAAGLFARSRNQSNWQDARFDNVRITIPAEPEMGSVHSLGSRLETLDVQTGLRRIVLTAPYTFEAPNWMPDGRALAVNAKGLLYRFDLAASTLEQIDTGFATRCNNDHLISPDGTMLGISHHSEQAGGASIVYVVPIHGGTPRQVTPRGPSYLHGWSPDGKYLAYTGERKGIFDIYKISLEGGDETRLTDTPGLDDGPEFSPDGRYIYFNSTRSGTMQIWRMRPDGSEQEQLTDDEYNNWFPHLCPDGESVVLLTYMSDVEPAAHPPNKHVYLRLMPARGGKPRALAYLYGGQGTMNVPSWSPDGLQLAFVSYSG